MSEDSVWVYQNGIELSRNDLRKMRAEYQGKIKTPRFGDNVKVLKERVWQINEWLKGHEGD